MTKFDSAVIAVPKSALKQGVVIMDLEEYEKTRAHFVPTYYLAGKHAENLDKEVDEAMREYRAGKTMRAGSIREALKLHARKKGNRS